MTPEIYYIELHLAQISDEMERINAKVDAGLYDNEKIMGYISILNDIVNSIQNIDLNSQNEIEKKLIKTILIFVSRCIQYIKSATVNDLRPAMYVCLRTALEDWVDSTEKYVLTSYKADVDSHHLLSITGSDQAIKMIKDVLGITIPYKLASLGYPTYLERDFLSNVSLYHELGHFVDICIWDFSRTMTEFMRAKGIPMPSVYFQNIDESILKNAKHPSFERERQVLNNMISEYFADIFAVQYIGIHKIHLAHYFAGDNDFSNSHPSTAARTQAIQNFLGPENQHDDFIKILKATTQVVSGRELKIRYAPLDATPLLSGHPYTSINREQLPSLFHSAWDIWVSNKSGFKDNPNTLGAYKKLNDLLDESVMNFLASKKP